MVKIDPQSEDWFRTAFNQLYPLIYTHRDDASAQQEVAGLIRLLGPARQTMRLLDLCCGTGRHAQALTGAGFEVFGLDLSEVLLAEAAQRPPLRGRLVRSDMRFLPLRESFHVVVNLFTSFGYFETDRDNAIALSEMVRILKPGGRLFLDHMNRTQVVKNLVKEDVQERPGMRIRQRRSVVGNRIKKKIEVSLEDGESIHLTENVRLFDPEEICGLARSLGLEEVRLLGGFDGQPFEPQSKRMLVLGRKPKV